MLSYLWFEHCIPYDFVARPARALDATRYRMRCVAACRRTRRLLHGCVAAGRRPTTNNRAEPVRERPFEFHLVQVPGVPVETLQRVTPNMDDRDRILFLRQMTNTVVVLVDNRLPIPRRGTKAFIHYQT